MFFINYTIIYKKINFFINYKKSKSLSCFLISIKITLKDRMKRNKMGVETINL